MLWLPLCSPSSHVPGRYVASTLSSQLFCRSFSSFYHLDKGVAPPGWTPDDDRELMRLYAEGKPVRDMREDIPSRSTRSISDRLTTLNAMGREQTPSSHLPWTTADDAKLKVLMEQGCSMAMAAKHFEDRSLSAIKQRWHNTLGLNAQLLTRPNSGKRYTKSEVDQVVSMYRAGEHIGSIADKLGRSYLGIGKLANRLMLFDEKRHRCQNPRRKWWTPEEDRKLLELTSQGYTHAQIACQLRDRTEHAVKSRLQERVHPRPITTPIKYPGLTANELSEKLQSLHSEGKSWDQIQDAFPSVAVRTLRRYNISARPREQLEQARLVKDDDASG